MPAKSPPRRSVNRRTLSSPWVKITAPSATPPAARSPASVDTSKGNAGSPCYIRKGSNHRVRVQRDAHPVLHALKAGWPHPARSSGGLCVTQSLFDEGLRITLDGILAVAVIIFPLVEREVDLEGRL